jgi:hypothetical protein
MCRENCECCCLPEGLEAFDLAKALAGREVVTRDGSRVLKLMHVPEADFSPDLIAVIAGQSDSSRHDKDDGEYYDCDGDRGDSDLDLFLKAPPQKRPFDLRKISQGAKVVCNDGTAVEWFKVTGACVTKGEFVHATARLGNGAEYNYTLDGLYCGYENDPTFYRHLKIMG